MSDSSHIKELQESLERQEKKAQTSVRLSIGTIITAIVAIGGAFSWASNVYTRVEALEEEVSRSSQADEIDQLAANQKVLKAVVSRLITTSKQTVVAGGSVFEGRREKLMISIDDAEKELDRFK